MWCTKHERVIDTWYDCERCLRDSQKWAVGNGYEACVSPHIEREGTDNGLWVTNHADTWVDAKETLKQADETLETLKSDVKAATAKCRKMRREMGMGVAGRCCSRGAGVIIRELGRERGEVEFEEFFRHTRPKVHGDGELA